MGSLGGSTLKTKNIDRAVNAVFAANDYKRLVWIIEKLVLPFGKEEYTRDELNAAILKTLKNKGHQIIEEDYEFPVTLTVHSPLSEEGQDETSN